MKKLFTLALLAVALQANAIPISESATRLDLEITWQLALPIDEPWWGDTDRRTTYEIDTPLYHIIIRDNLDGLVISGGRTGSVGLESFNFEIEFADFPLRWAEAAVTRGGGRAEILGHDRLRISFGDVVGVPESCSTLGLLGLALGGLAFCPFVFGARLSRKLGKTAPESAG